MPFPSQASGASFTRQLRVFIVDDDPGCADSLADLGLWGHEVQTGYGSDALPVILDFKPDVLILDLLMPGVNGLELAAILRNHPHFRNVTFMAVTGLHEDKFRTQAIEAGIDLFLLKPVPPEVLQDALSAIASKGRPDRPPLPR